MPFFLVLVMCAGAASLAWLIRDYRTIKAEMPRLAVLEEETRLKQAQFEYLSRRIESIGDRLAELNEFDAKLRVMVNPEASDDSSEYSGVGGSDPALWDPKKSADTHGGMLKSMHRALDALDQDTALAKAGKTQLHSYLESQKKLLASTPSIWPTRGWLSSRFGTRISPFTGEKEFHRGIDISSRKGSPVVAPAQGVVSSVGKDRGYGTVITLSHGYGLKTRYAHLHKTLVKKGQHVKRGDTIALVGNTGRSTGSHLHYEVFLNKVRVDPLHYILK